MKSVKIRVLPAPPSDLSSFDPGKYLSELDFCETPDAITETDRDGLAQMVHYLAFLALDAKSSKWETSVIPKDTSAFRALQSHFGQLSGWKDMVAGENELSYRQLASFLMEPYPPHRPKQN